MHYSIASVAQLLFPHARVLSFIDHATRNLQSIKKKGPTRTDMLKRKVKEVNAKKRSNTIAKMSVEGRGL